MTMTMDDDGAILVHLTNPGGIVGGTGVANQITYWTDTDTIGGDPGLTYDAATDTITIAGNILMASDHFIGITGDIRIEFDRADGDIMFHLGDAAGADEVQVVDSGSVVVAYVDSDGNVDFAGHMAVGGAAAISATRILDVHEVFTDLAGVIEGAYFYTEANPAADSAATFKGVAVDAYNKSNNNIAALQCLSLRAINEGSGTITNIYGLNAYVENSTGVTSNQYGIYFYARQNAGGTTAAAYGGYFRVRRVGGTMTTGYGISIRMQGVMDTAYGLYIAAVTEAGTNYAIYCAGGDSYHAGKVSIGGTVAPLAQLHVDQGSASGAIPVLYLDQGDVSEDMIEFACTIGVGNAIEAVGGKTLTTTHFIKISIPGGLTRYIPVGTIA